MNIEQIEALKQRVLAGGQITPEEALSLSETSEKEALYTAADAIRAHFSGQKIDLCSIMNAQSGRCSEDCKWCSQSVHFKTGVPEYSLVSAEEAVKLAQENSRQGVGRFSLVTSGRALKPKQIQEACKIYEAIRKDCDIALCASMGLLRTPELQKLKDAGVERYHCNIETAPSHFPTLCTTHTFEEKQRTIREAQALGMKICSGGIFGMGETMAQRIEMAFVLREMEIDSIPINILNPIEGTPLAGSSPLSDDEILVTIALFRFINPTAHLRFAGGRNLIFHIQEKALSAGVSAALVGDYLTTLGASVEQDKAMFERMGRA
ncbi:biotin synthase [Formivibrio citricus]|uniref:Biotin synthase n=1 Tax=Formivibrio citricus TaxID=83765 RepID=A0A1I4VRX6_9NEIS|nr:biotin synthase BioB [Formivibrio citricus]SFN04028.1 biotin synthase [Formivibrio citricus]